MTALEALSGAESLLAARDLSGARKAFESAVSLGADANHCAGALWQIHMLAGDIALAWRQSDLLRQRNAPDPHRLWNGEEIEGKRVIVRCLHGFGDTVQMLRYTPLLKQKAAYVTWEVAPRLVPLARHFSGVDEVVTWGEQAPAQPPEWEVQVEVMELPYMFRTVRNDLPLGHCYLTVPTIEMPPRSRPRIGLVWSAASWNPNRNLPFPLMQALLADARFEFWSLQHGPSPDLRLVSQPAVTGDGVLPLAQTIAALDLVISVDTLAAHLAGALGPPCWLLLQYAADWRWMHRRNDSPWYPSMSLFRQQTPGDWAGVVAEVQHRLATLNL